LPLHGLRNQHEHHAVNWKEFVPRASAPGRAGRTNWLICGNAYDLTTIRPATMAQVTPGLTLRRVSPRTRASTTALPTAGVIPSTGITPAEDDHWSGAAVVLDERVTIVGLEHTDRPQVRTTGDDGTEDRVAGTRAGRRYHVPNRLVVPRDDGVLGAVGGVVEGTHGPHRVVGDRDAVELGEGTTDTGQDARFPPPVVQVRDVWTGLVGRVVGLADRPHLPSAYRDAVQ